MMVGNFFHHFAAYFSYQSHLDLEQDGVQIVNLIARLNFTILSSFNCTIMCPVSLAHSVADVFSREGASMTQQGFVHHKRQPSRKQGEQTYNI